MRPRARAAPWPWLAALPLAACLEPGRPWDSTPAPAAPPDLAAASSNSSGPEALNMRLESHLELQALAEAAHVDHDEPFAVAGPLSAAGNWGYTAPDGRRFALTGTSVGLSIVEVSDPAAPRPLALVHGPESQWREVKTYGSYAYVTTEARHGLDIVDMRDPDHPARLQTWDRSFASAHTLWIDADRALLFANGTRDASGQATGMRILSLEDPANPREVGSFTGFYVHDSYLRGDTLYASAIKDGFCALLDVGNPREVRERSRFFTGGRFTHNAWPTPDGRHLFTTDERSDHPLEGWDLSDPAAPRKVSEYLARPGTIPHNVMLDGSRLLVSHYTEGVHLLDVRDPERPRLLGFYDTYDGGVEGFAGAWGAYVFPGSDLVLASDIGGGLYVLRYVGPGG